MFYEYIHISISSYFQQDRGFIFVQTNQIRNRHQLYKGGIVMKKTILIAMAGFLTFGAVVMLSSRNAPDTDTDTASLKSYYGAVIDRVIAECRTRSRPRSGRIERASVFNCFKATYFRLRRNELIVDLLDKNIGKNEFLTRYHLNGNFHHAIRELPSP